MENNNTDISFSPTISKQIRTALFDIMQDGGVYTTSEIRTQMEKRFNLAYKRDYNINHFWGVINSLLKSDKLKRKNNGFYLVASHLQQQVLTLTETADCEHMSSINQKNTDIIEHSNSMPVLYTEIVQTIIQPNIEKEQQTPKIQCFRGFLYILKIYQTPSKHTKMFR